MSDSNKWLNDGCCAITYLNLIEKWINECLMYLKLIEWWLPSDSKMKFKIQKLLFIKIWDHKPVKFRYNTQTSLLREAGQFHGVLQNQKVKPRTGPSGHHPGGSSPPPHQSTTNHLSWNHKAARAWPPHHVNHPKIIFYQKSIILDFANFSKI